MKIISTALNCTLLTVSDTRTADNDTSGNYLATALATAGHQLADRKICQDNRYIIRAIASQWIAQPAIQVILITGGTGFAQRDVTPEAVRPLFDKDIPGFGELFRHISFAEIGSSTVQSRALAGWANNTLIFCLPGSTHACETAWQHIIASQLDEQTKPCNFVKLLVS